MLRGLIITVSVIYTIKDVADACMGRSPKTVCGTSFWPWCDPTLGTLDITEDWHHDDRRPNNDVPSSRKNIGTQFFIHTRKRRNANVTVQLFNIFYRNHEVIAKQASTLIGTGFDATKPTKFIIHGWNDYLNVKLLKEMAQSLLDYGDYNVFCVVWGRGTILTYSKGVGNLRVVGLEIGYLVNWLKEYYHLDPANVHLIGHSLGAHIAGYAGEQIPGLGRISGLDPSGSYFSFMPSFVRLDETDAIFVDTYNTDTTYWGTPQGYGNINFYPNGGQHQPGCNKATALVKMIIPGGFISDLREIGFCNHDQAVKIFMDTLKNPTLYTAIWCNQVSYTECTCGSCDEDPSKCAYVGLRASEFVHKKRVDVEMYFDT